MPRLATQSTRTSPDATRSRGLPPFLLSSRLSSRSLCELSLVSVPGILGASLPTPSSCSFVFYFKGEYFRSRSKFAMSLSKDMAQKRPVDDEKKTPSSSNQGSEKV